MAIREEHYRATLKTSSEGLDMTLADHIEEVLKEAQPRLKRIARARGVAADQADDVVQETLLEAWRHLDHLREPERFDAWLNGICRNVCLRWAHKQGSAHREVSSSTLGDADSDDQPARGVDMPDLAPLDLVEELSRHDLEVLVDRALSYLPADTRQALELHYLADMPQHEVAARLGLATNVLEVRLHRARRQLRRLLSNELRPEAELLGLPLDREQPPGWRPSRLWCMLCGRQHLLGLFAPLMDGKVDFCLRCPVCEPTAADPPQIRTLGAVPLGKIRSFRPAWKRVLRTLAQAYAPVFETGALACPSCGGRAQVIQSSTSAMAHPASDRLCLGIDCPRCGEGYHILVSSLTLGLPIVQEFLDHHPRWIIEPEAMIDHAALPAIRVRLLDATSTSALTLFLHQRTLRFLGSFPE